MKIGHTLEKRKLLRDRYLYVPHECSIPGCPGNRNRQRLELFDEMLAALEGLSAEIKSGPKHTGMTLVWLDKASSIIANAKELK